MKALKKFVATTAAALVLMGGVASAATVDKTCAGYPVVNVGSKTSAKLTVNHTLVKVGNDSAVTVTGNDNCVVAGSGDSIKIVGNDNYASASSSSVTFKGTSNAFRSGGNNFVQCNGAQAVLQASDYGVACNEV